MWLAAQFGVGVWGSSREGTWTWRADRHVMVPRVWRHPGSGARQLSAQTHTSFVIIRMYTVRTSIGVSFPLRHIRHLSSLTDIIRDSLREGFSLRDLTRDSLREGFFTERPHS